MTKRDRMMTLYAIQQPDPLLSERKCSKENTEIYKTILNYWSMAETKQSDIRFRDWASIVSLG